MDIVDILSLSLHLMPQGGYDSGSETNPNSVAESESDSSDECDLHFLTIFGGYF